MPTPIDVFYNENRNISERLANLGEISLKATFDSLFAKSLLIAVTSFFEKRIQDGIIAFVQESSQSPLVDELIQSKAINRQYHTYFNWETAKNANSFFALFGSDFREFMEAEVKQNPELDSAVKAFLDLGRDRNNVVHVDFATNAAAKTFDEVYNAYQTALQFVDALPVKYREFTRRQEG